jgi:hypothetical protein
MKKNMIKIIAVSIIGIFVLSNSLTAFGLNINKTDVKKSMNVSSISDVKYIEYELSFSYPEIVKHGNYWVVRVSETNHNRYVLFDLNPGKPVLPVNISVFKLIFGSKILNVKYENSTEIKIDIPGELAYCQAAYDTTAPINKEIPKDLSIYEGSDPFPYDWVTYHTGGGLYEEEHTSFLVSRVYPIRFYPSDNQLGFTETIKVNISYVEPSEPILGNNDVYDLLILAPDNFKGLLNQLVAHKTKFGVRTRLYSIDYVNNNITEGRDVAENIKLFIKQEIEKNGIKYVLLVGGIKGQSLKWNIPVRRSRVVPMDEQEYPEQSFISDLYYADIYDSEGNFSSWDSNDDDEFSVWNESFKEEMDVYPDVYLGRLDCRTNFEVFNMVRKIKNYEKTKCSEKDWFKNLILVGGDSYNDTDTKTNYNEGELICEKAITLMPGFNPVRVYANDTTGEDINRKTVNKAMNAGSSFAYFCGHGNLYSWNTHFPYDQGWRWTEGYQCGDMLFLRNNEKLPITVVGGCHNGEFDVSLANIIKGIQEYGLFGYFGLKPGSRNRFMYPRDWYPNCWAWWLTSAYKGGAIATIANTGLGTHGHGDLDNNSIADYLEILDGWLELRFLEMYGVEEKDILGLNHGDTLIEYLNRFMGDETKMDVKMVQQWELFGDPSLKIGGYN